MKNDSICPTIRELERVYDLIADRFKFTALRPIITIQSKGRQAALGWHCDKQWTNGTTEISEINICAEELDKHPISTLIHEMVHHSNAVEKINDCNSSQYHNKKFKEKAEMYGLNVEKNSRFGWALTSIGDKLQERLNEIKINYDLFKLIRIQRLRIKAETKMKKWSCECTVVRCATVLSAVCEICKNHFEEKE